MYTIEHDGTEYIVIIDADGGQIVVPVNDHGIEG